MKRLFFGTASVLLLSACNGSPSATFDLEIDVKDPAMQQELVQQSLNVMDRRLQMMGDVLMESTVHDTDDGARVTITAETQEALDALALQLQNPFQLSIMNEAREGQTPDVTVEGHGGFVESGVTGQDLEWMAFGTQQDSRFGEVTLNFTEEGRAKMQTLFAENVGRNIGLFVNRQLVSKLLVDTAELKDDIVIREIPNPELAQVFAEDVNVGIHVIFTPIP